MMRQQVTRRIILGAFTVALLLPASAAGAAPVFGPDDFGSRKDFEDHCDTAGGTVIDTEDGNLWCHRSNGVQTVCDSEGNDCYTIHSEDQEPSSPWGPTGPTDGVGPVDGGTNPAPPVTDPSAPEGDSPTASDPEPRDGDAGLDEPTQDHTKGKGKKGKHGKKGGKHRKR